MIALDFITASATPPEKLYELLASGREGLSVEDATQRLEKVGYNRVSIKPIHGWKILLRQFRSSFVYLLLAATVIALALREFIDAAFIAFFLAINAALGFIQEYRAEHALTLLKQFVPKAARVRRSGREMIVSADLVVPGDIVLLFPGDTVPADGVFLLAQNLAIDESPLTGESKPVEKIFATPPQPAKTFYDAKNVGFSGTTVLRGEGELLIFSTGRATAVGDIATQIETADAPSGFEIGISNFSRFVLRLVLLTIPFVFVANAIIEGENLHVGAFLLFSIALIVGVIPEALPLVTTLAITQGALRLARMQVVPRRLSAVEDLGSIDVLCTDKTGTLTENALAVAEVFGNREEVLAAALFASAIRARNPQDTEDKFDHALLAVSANDAVMAPSQERIFDAEPFDPQRRRESVLRELHGERLLFLRGAPEALFGGSIRTDAAAWVQAEGSKGRRILAVGKKRIDESMTVIRPPKDEEGCEVIGFISFADPLKQTAHKAIQDAEALGVRVKILTGDSKEVAGWVAYELGITKDADDVLTGEAFDALLPEQQEKAVERCDVFARVMPAQKLRIVELLRQRHLVGFLGEGFNDAPALKAAHVALAVEGASGIAQDASDIVLLNRSLDVIINGIREGRKIFANTTKYIRATLTGNFGNFYAIAFASLVIDFLPMLPVQILLVNLLTDFPMLSTATDAVDDRELRRPKSYNVRDIAFVAIVLGLVSTAFDFAFFGFFLPEGEHALQTMWFIGSILTELVLLFSIRTALPFFRARRPSAIVLSLTALIAGITVALPFTGFGQTAFHLVRPTSSWMLTAALLVLGYFVMTEIVKLWYYRTFRTNH